MERGKGIEPSALAWKARVLPLYEPRIKLVRVVGLEPNVGARSGIRTRKAFAAKF